MRASDDADLAALESVTRKLTASMRSIRPDQWSSATPCSAWDLTALVDHLTGGNWFTVAVLAGQRAETAITATRQRFGDGSVGSEAAIRSLADQIVAFRRPQVLDRTWNHIAADLSGRQVLRLRLHDLIVHSWDVEQALRPGATLPADLVRWGVDELLDDGSLTAQHFHLVDLPVVRAPDGGSTSYLAVSVADATSAPAAGPHASS